MKSIEVEKLVADTLNTELKIQNLLLNACTANLQAIPFIKTVAFAYTRRRASVFQHAGRLLAVELEAIQNLRQGADILELILRKIQKLPEETRELLMLASCYGNKFDLETLSSLWNKPMERTAASLMPSIREGLVIMLEKEDAIYSSERPVKENTVYEFLHDQVQQAVYSLFTKEERRKSIL